MPAYSDAFHLDVRRPPPTEVPRVADPVSDRRQSGSWPRRSCGKSTLVTVQHQRDATRHLAQLFWNSPRAPTQVVIVFTREELNRHNHS